MQTLAFHRRLMLAEKTIVKRWASLVVPRPMDFEKKKIMPVKHAALQRVSSV